MKKIFQILLFVSAGLLMNSCYYDALVEVPELPTDPDDPDYKEVLYGAEIQPIWNSRCTACHDDGHAIDLREGVSYDELVPDYVIAEDADNSILYLKLQTDHGKANNDEMALIKSWIDQGAKDN